MKTEIELLEEMEQYANPLGASRVRDRIKRLEGDKGLGYRPSGKVKMSEKEMAKREEKRRQESRDRKRRLAEVLESKGIG